jgi:hypothetical protein
MSLAGLYSVNPSKQFSYCREGLAVAKYEKLEEL